MSEKTKELIEQLQAQYDERLRMLRECQSLMQPRWRIPKRYSLAWFWMKLRVLVRGKYK